MKKVKRLSVFLIIAALLMSMFSGLGAIAAEEVYTAAEAFTPGNNYIIAAEYNGEYYALACDGALGAEKITVSGDTATPASDNVKWLAGDGDTVESVAAPGYYIFAGSGGFMLWNSGRTFVYDAAGKYVLMHDIYYLTFDGTKFDYTKTEAEAAEIRIFESAAASAPVAEAGEPEGDYVAADAFELGNRYVIATEYNGEYYAFAYTAEGLVAEKITVNGDKATITSDSVKWTASDGDTVENVGTPGTFVYAGSYGLMTYFTGRTFTYNAAEKCIYMHNLYYLTFDGSKFDESKDAADACEVVIFEKEMPKIAAEEKFIPDGSDLPSVVRDAKKNADGSITLAFASDVHHSRGYAQNNLEVWLNNMKGEIGYIDAMGFCGDMGSAYAATADEYWADTQAAIDYMDTQVAAGYVGTTVYTYGNHEWYPMAGGDYMNNYENNPTADRLLRVGEGLKTDDYIFYCLGSGDIAAQMSQGYSEEDIERIATYLASAPKDIPIFVLTHFPIHFWGDRLTKNADKLVAVLNQYPNVVVIWGHNHSDFDTAYDAVCHAGDVITIDNKGTQATLNFDYLSAGCISDAEYTGVNGGSAWVLGKGLIVTIGADGKLSYDYYTMDAKKMSEEGPYLVEYRDNISYSTIATEYVEAGKAANPPAVPEIPNYKFTGWDADLSAINRHTVATATYEFDTGLDDNYVYFTIQENGGIAVGKSGTPILQYAIPYTEGMTSLDAVKALQDAEMEGGSPEVASGGYGYIASVWGHTSPNGAWVMDPGSTSCYIYATDKLVPGRSYYIYALEANEYTATSYLTPFVNNADVGEAVSMEAAYWIFDLMTYVYSAVPLDGDVYAGKTIDTMTDTGIDAVGGKFDISFDEAGEYYVGVKGTGAALAVNKISVTKPVVVASTQSITLNGVALDVEAYNINGNNYFKLRDLAYCLNETSAKFGVVYDEAADSVAIAVGEAYIPDGTELQKGEDKSSTAVKSRQTVYVDGVIADVAGYNIGGNNFYKIADLADLIGFELAYDASANTAQITA